MTTKKKLKKKIEKLKKFKKKIENQKEYERVVAQFHRKDNANA